LSGKAWHGESLGHLIYNARKEDAENICLLGNGHLNKHDIRSAHFLTERECMKLVGYYSDHFNYCGNQHFQQIEGGPQSKTSFQKKIEFQIKQFESKGKIPEDAFYIVNTHDEVGRHWYVIGVSFNQNYDFSKSPVSSEYFTPSSSPVTPQNFMTPSSRGKTRNSCNGKSSTVPIVSTPKGTKGRSTAEPKQLSKSKPYAAALRNSQVLKTGNHKRSLEKSEFQEQQENLHIDIFSFADSDDLTGTGVTLKATKERTSETNADHSHTLRSILQNFAQKKTYLPVCLAALGIIYKNYAQKIKKNELPPGKEICESLPNFLGSYKENLKNIKKNVKAIVEIVEQNDDVKTASLNSSVDSELFQKHHQIVLTNGKPCDLCFPSSIDLDTESHESSDEDVKLERIIFKALDEFLENNPEIGKMRLREKVSGFLNKYFLSESNDSNPDGDSISAIIVKKDEEKSDTTSIHEKLSNFKDNMLKHCVTLWYGLGLSRKQVNDIDRLVHCERRPAGTIHDLVKKLPNFKKIKSRQKDYSHDKVLDYYLEYIKLHQREPNFTELGKLYELEGPKHGVSDSSVSKAAMSVVYNGVIANPNKCIGLISIIEHCIAMHPIRYHQFSIGNNLKIPRFTPIKKANEKLKEAIEAGIYDIGDNIMPSVFTSYDFVSNKSKERILHIRKKSLRKIRQKILDDHSSKGILKEYPDNYYKNLDRDIVLKTLEDYNMYYEVMGENFTTDELREILKKAERTRELLTWFDHATILNHSMILYTVNFVFSNRVYKENGTLRGHALQKYVERPVVYMVGLSRSTTEEEEKFGPVRLEDILDISHKVVSKNGIEYEDVYRFFTGDQQARNVEVSHNRSGNFRMATLPADLSEEKMKFYELLQLKHRDYLSMQKHALAGGFYDNESNVGKSLQDFKTIDMAKARKIDTTLKTDKEILSLLHKNLEGRRNVPMLLKMKPKKLLVDMNLRAYEVIPFEGLHDMKDLVSKAMRIIPGDHLKNANVPRNADENYEREIKFMKALHEKISPIINREQNDVNNLKNTKSGETTYNMLIDITHQLQKTCLQNGSCPDCGPIFTLTEKSKCVKCLIVGFYRCMFELHTISNSDFTKRTPYRICRAYLLVFILHIFLDKLCSRFPEMEDDLNCIYKSIHFIDLIYYLPLAHEISNTLSYHTGRQEAMFNKLKKICLNNTNRRVYSDNLMLQMLIRLECQNKFQEENTKFLLKTSVTSKKVSKLLLDFPYDNIVFTKAFLLKEDATSKLNLQANFERLSNFIVANDECEMSGRSYFKIDSNNSMVFPMPACQCNTSPGNCPVCDIIKMPPFNISNSLTSSISNLLTKKFEISNSNEYKQKLSTIMSNEKNTDSNSSSESSGHIISSVSIDRKNPAHQTFKPTLKSISSTLDVSMDLKNHSDFYSQINHSPLLKCIAMVLKLHEDDESRTEILKADKKEGNRSRRMSTQHVRSRNEEIEYSLLKHYINILDKYKPRLEHLLSQLAEKITEHSRTYDNLLLNCSENDIDDDDVDFMSIESALCQERETLTSLQKRKLACLEILTVVDELIEVNAMCLIDYK
jgi:hypothetical protein